MQNARKDNRHPSVSLPLQTEERRQTTEHHILAVPLSDSLALAAERRPVDDSAQMKSKSASLSIRITLII